ncbi:MAG: hypothetical protein N838_34780 [Thiohalocapsa sp. PB-PSB1]|nr:MAG: hypothetical protein N838_34780 [Thiohalocapsa sp. PB-PSB1]
MDRRCQARGDRLVTMRVLEVEQPLGDRRAISESGCKGIQRILGATAPAHSSTSAWLKTTIRTSFSDNLRPVRLKRKTFSPAACSAVVSAASGAETPRRSPAALRQTISTSRSIGDLAASFDIATDIPALTGCACTSRKPACSTAAATEVQPSSREWW